MARDLLRRPLDLRGSIDVMRRASRAGASQCLGIEPPSALAVHITAMGCLITSPP